MIHTNYNISFIKSNNRCLRILCSNLLRIFSACIVLTAVAGLTACIENSNLFTTIPNHPGVQTDMYEVKVSQGSENTLLVSWKPPADTANIDYYLIELQTAASTRQYRVPVAAAAELTQGKQVETFRVKAEEYLVTISMVKKTDGQTVSLTTQPVARTVVSAATAAAPPNINQHTSTVTPGNKVNIELPWTPPAEFGTTHNGNKASISSYIIYWKKKGKAGDLLTRINYEGIQKIDNPHAITATISELDAYPIYMVLLVLINSAGLESSASVEISTPFAVLQPGSVTDVLATPHADSAAIDLQWAKSTNFGLQADNTTPDTFKEYRIYWTKSSSINTADAPQHTISDLSITSYTIPATKLKGFTQYTIAITVVNSSNISSTVEATSQATVKTVDLSTPPGKIGSNIQQLTGVKTINTLVLTWEPAKPVKNREGDDITTEYDIYYDTSGYRDAESLMSSTSAHKVSPTMGIDITEEVLTYYDSEQNEQLLHVVQYTLENLRANTAYDVVVVPVNREIGEEGTPSSLATLRSTGVSSVAIMEGGNPLQSLTKDTAAPIELTADVASYNVDVAVTWVSTNTDVATITANGNTATVYPQKQGSTTITAQSVADSTQTANLLLTINKENIGQGTYELSYGSAALYTDSGVEATFPIQQDLLPQTQLNFAVTDISPKTQGITIPDTNTGTIQVDATVLADTYTIEIEANVANTNLLYTGTLSKHIVIEIRNPIMRYKPEMDSNARAVFSIGDIDNPYLFQILNMPDTTGATATITIDDGSRELYKYENAAVTTFLKSGTTIAGVGPDSNNKVDFAQLNGYINITVTVTQNGTEYAKKILTTLTAAADNLYSWRDLQAMQTDLAASYTIQNDIVFPEPEEYGFSTAGFVPIGRDEDTSSGYQGTPFTGMLDGNGKSITGLLIDNSSLDYIGLFGKIEASTAAATVVQDITLVNPSINANAVVGSLAGFLEKGTIRNAAVQSITIGAATVANNGTVLEPSGSSGPLGHTGGLIGLVGEEGIVNATSDAYVTCYSYACGGLVGTNLGIVIGWSTGNLTASSVSTSFWYGGLVGYNHGGTVVGYATGSISGNDAVAGLVGASFNGPAPDNKEGVIIGYATGSVTGSKFLGSLVGRADTKEIGFGTGRITDLGTPQNNFVGGLTGAGEVVIGYWDQASTGQTTSANDLFISTAFPVSSKSNIYIFRGTADPAGRTPGDFYDAGNDGQDENDVKIFNNPDFQSIFEMPTEDGAWPKLKKTFNYDGVDYTIPEACYDYQSTVLGW